MTDFRPFYNETIDGFDYYMCPLCGCPLDEMTDNMVTTFVACINDDCDYYYENGE